ncbi:MAG: hypothetical protein NUV78_02910 [Candidatus Zambryskibacteria bacterium]|nr:hypothetical protein [Candidatus Zambryskibacteria bacterium]
MEKNVAVAVALVVIGGAFFMGNTGEIISRKTDSPGLSLSIIPSTFKAPSLELPGISTKSNKGDELFTTFTQYREYARNENIAGIENLSYQLSLPCQEAETNAESKAECLKRIGNVYRLTKDFAREDFVHVFHDNRQAVLLSDYESLNFEGEQTPPLRKVLLFAMDAQGNPKLLGIKFCPENVGQAACFEMNASLRDQDNNGWWDQIEEHFAR